MSRYYQSQLGSGAGSSGWAAPASAPKLSAPAVASDVGKLNIDVTNPIGSITGLAGDLFGGIGDVGIGPLTVKNAVGTAGNIAGGVGDIGAGGFGVKQALGVAGEALAAPGRYVQTRFATLRIAEAQKQADWAKENKARGFTDAQLQASGGISQDVTLPADLQLQLDQGVSVEHVANQLADRNAGFTSDPGLNTLGSIILDPMNLVSFGAGKVAGLGARAGIAAQAAQEARSAGLAVEDVSTATKVIGSMYNAATKGLSQAGSATLSRTLGPVTSGINRAMPELMPTISRLTRLDPAAGRIAASAGGTANANLLHAAVSGMVTEDFAKAGTGMMALRSDQRAIQAAQLGTQQLLAPKALEATAEALGRAKLLTPTVATAGERAAEAAAWLVKATGTSEDVAAQMYKGKATVAEWQAARQLAYGAAAKDVVKLRIVDASAGGLKSDLLTLLSPDTYVAQTMTKDAAALEGASSFAAKEARKAAKEAKRTGKAVPETLVRPALVEDPLLTDLLGPASKVPEGAAVSAETAVSIARRILEAHPDVAYDLRKASIAAGRNGRVTSAEVLAYLKGHVQNAPTELNWPTTGKHALPSEFAAFRDKWAKDGYQLGFEPVAGYKMYEDAMSGKNIILRPFTSLVDDSIGLAQRNPLGKVYDALFGGIRQSRIIAEAQDRLTSYGAKYGMTPDEGQALMRGILTTAHDLKSTPRAIYEQFPPIFKSILGEPRLAELRTKGLNPLFAINHAFEGNLETIGLTQKITGIAKTRLGTATGNLPVKIAEQMYPNLKFKWNPTFTMQEIIESPFFNTMRGINPWTPGVISPELESLYGAVIKNQIARNVFEAGWATQMSAALNARDVVGAGSRFGNFVDKITPGLRTTGLGGFKEKQALMQVAREMPNEFKDAMTKISPLAWQAMEESYKTTDAAVIAEAFLKERLAMTAGQRELGSVLDKIEAAGKQATVEGETAWQAFRYALTKSSDQAYKTHFFNPSRGWIERTINHPYLGLYPISYMWGKVVPEFARFLFVHPFGMDAPLLGYNAAQHVQQTLLVQMQDPEFAKQVADNAAMIYFVQLMLPATPTNIPVNAPAWGRHLATAQAEGKKYNPATETSDMLQHIGVMNVVNTWKPIGGLLGQAVGGLTDQLDHAAALYDNNR